MPPASDESAAMPVTVNVNTVAVRSGTAKRRRITKIVVEVQYLRDFLRVLVRDNGYGIKPEAVQKESDSHWGLRGMRKRAENIGARFDIESRTGAGTEVRVAVPIDIVKRTTHDRGRWEERSEI